MNNAITITPCPICGQGVSWGEKSPYSPFCCKRCQLIDFGEWVNEEKQIPSDMESADDEKWSEKDQ